MFQKLGRLAAANGKYRVAKVAGTAASFLTFAFFTTGCSVILEPTQGSRFFQALALLIQHLPEGAPVAIEEFVRAWLGENFAEKFTEAMSFIAPRPVISDGIWGRLFDALAGIMLAVMLVYGYLYLRKMFRAIDKHGADAVNEGRGGIVPPFQYLGRYLMVAFLVIGLPVLLQKGINLTWEVVHGFWTGAYSDVGFTVGEVMFELLLKMVSGGGLRLVTIAFMLIFIGAALLLFAGFYFWNYLMLFIRAGLAVFKTPRFLNAEPDDLEPLVNPTLDALESVAFLGIRWGVFALTPFALWWIVTDLLGDSDSPLIPVVIAIGWFVFLLLATVGPWIVFGFRLFGIRIRKGLSRRIPDLLRPNTERLDETRGRTEAAVAGIATGVAATEAARQGWLRREGSRIASLGDRLASGDPGYRQAKTRVQQASSDLKSGNVESLRNAWNGSRAQGQGGASNGEPRPGPSSEGGPIPAAGPSTGPASPRPRPSSPSQGGASSSPKARSDEPASTEFKSKAPGSDQPQQVDTPTQLRVRVPIGMQGSTPGANEKTQTLPAFERLLEELTSSKLPVGNLSDEELAVCAALRMEHYGNSSDEDLIAATEKFLKAQSGADRNMWHDIGTKLRALLP